MDNKVENICLGVSPITNKIYAYFGDSKESGEIDIDKSSDVTNLFVGCIRLLLNSSSNGVIEFSSDDMTKKIRIEYK